MDFIDGTIYIKHEGKFKPLMTLHNGYAHAEGHQSKAYGQHSHVKGHVTETKPYNYLFEDVSNTIDTSVEKADFSSTIEILQSQMAELGSRIGEATAAIKDLKEEVDKIKKKDMFDTYFGVDYSKGSDF